MRKKQAKHQVRANDLPEAGQAVFVDELIRLASRHGKSDIVNILQSAPPPDVFVSDGCSMWPDSWLGADLYPSCFWHDVRYWCGIPGDDMARLKADVALAIDVGEAANPALGRLMFTGVGIGGTDLIDTPFKWGYGR